MPTANSPRAGCRRRATKDRRASPCSFAPPPRSWRWCSPPDVRAPRRPERAQRHRRRAPDRPQALRRYVRDVRGRGADRPHDAERRRAQGPAASSFETFVRFIRNTDPGSNAGMPGLTIPAGLGPTTGLPVGVSLDGLPDSDERLLAVGLAIEQVLGRTPPPSKRSLTVAASARGTLVSLRVIGGRFRGRAARVAALDHGRRRAAARRRRARRRRGRPRVALAPLSPPRRHTVGRLPRKGPRRRRRLGRPPGAARRVATTRRCSVWGGGVTAGPLAATKLDASGVTRSRPRTGSSRRTSTSATRASCTARRPKASSRTATTAFRTVVLL